MLKNNHLKARRLQFLRGHQEAFDVEPTFMLSLFEEAVLGIEGTCGVESQCNVEKAQLFAIDFQVSNDEGRTWPMSLTHAVKFMDKIESTVGVRLNRNLLEQFATLHLGSHKIHDNTVGIDLRPRNDDSCIKVYLHLAPEEDPEELVKTALELDGGSYSPELIQVLLKSTIVIGFNLFLNGYSDIELWATSPGEQYEVTNSDKGKYLKHYIQRIFSPKINYLFQESTFLVVVFSKNVEPILMFNYEDIKEIPKNFLFNTLGDRIYSFCQGQDCMTYAGVSVTERELEKDRLENFSIFYNQRDECQPLLHIKKRKD
ncbi:MULTISPECIES: LynF/TruF/PatF family peptide O-prenyltransferase [unclassified Microcoleus]|nr:MULTISPECIES: LynF/TruF/PatF family peptide O-prenyltransferase [unclassified Microcoleus]